ncbi:MAG: hypothetical protein ABSB53_07710 [Nitrososphaerales archaeon]
MNRRTTAIVAIALFCLAVFIMLVPVVSTALPCQTLSLSSCHPQPQYESMSFYFFGVGGFYFPCWGYHVIDPGKGSWEFSCAIPTTATNSTTSETTTTSIVTITSIFQFH